MTRLFAVILLCSATPALAQTTYVNPTINGGYVATTPGSGQPPIYYNRGINGSYTVTQPGSGQPPAYINRGINGSYTITQPGANYPYGR